MTHPPVVLTVAGSDPSGGAGLQADLKTIHRHGGYGAAVPTLLTVQNTEGVQSALQGDVSKCRLKLPEHFAVEIAYREHAMARKASFFPGAELKQPHSIGFESDDYFEILRLFSFVL